MLLQILVEQVDRQRWLADSDQFGQIVGIARQLAHRCGLLGEEVLLQVVCHLGIMLAVVGGAMGGAGVHMNGALCQFLLDIQGMGQGLELIEMHLWWLDTALGMWFAQINGATAASHLLDQLNGVVKGAIGEGLIELLEAGAVHLV